MGSIRWGLCCLFKEAPIKYRVAMATYMGKLKRSDQLAHLSQIIFSNLHALEASIDYVALHGIGSFRITSQLLPLYTQPTLGYQINELPEAASVYDEFSRCKQSAKEKGIRLTFHPDQFVVLNSPHAHVVTNSIQELEYHGLLSELLGADVINIHAGGVYGNKRDALVRLTKEVENLSPEVRERLTLENDDKSYTPEDLYPVCKMLEIPLVYDVHHHRCNQDGLSIEEASELAYSTWNREPLFHISSPLEGWEGRKRERHHDYISFEDFPRCWLHMLPLTVEVEAKAKELAVLKIMQEVTHN